MKMFHSLGKVNVSFNLFYNLNSQIQSESAKSI